MEQNKTYQALTDVISQCTAQLTNIQQQEYHIQRREIEDHFERCIHALDGRRADLLNQLDMLKNERSEVIQTNLATHISICKDILKAGCNVFNASSAIADSIWQGALKLEKPSTDGACSIEILLPDILNLLSSHGSITEIANGSTTFTNNVQSTASTEIVVYTENTTVVQHYDIVSIQQFAKVDLVKTFVGSVEGDQDGKGTYAKFNGPWGLCFNPHDECLYVSDYWNHTIKKVALSGQVTTFVKNIKTPTGIVMNYQERCFYVINAGQHCITKISPFGRTIIFAGTVDISGSADGIGTAARFNYPAELAIDQKSGTLFVSDRDNHLIRKISPQGKVTTLAGLRQGFSDGPGEKACFHSPLGICFDEQDQSVIVSDYGNNKLRRIKLNGEVSTICDIHEPGSIIITEDQLLLVTTYKQMYRVYHSGDTYKVEVLAESYKSRKRNGSEKECTFDDLCGIAIHPSTRTCFVADRGKHVVQKISFEACGKI